MKRGNKVKVAVKEYKKIYMASTETEALEHDRISSCRRAMEHIS